MAMHGDTGRLALHHAHCPVAVVRGTPVGAGDRSPVRRALIASTADWLIHNADCPVLVVPPAAVVAQAHPDVSTTAGA